MKTAQFRPKRTGASVCDAVHQRPEAGTVIHLPGVAQFVQQHVVGQVGGQQHEEQRQVDATPGGAASPPRVCRIDFHAGVGETVSAGQLSEPSRQVTPCLFAQLFRDGLEQEPLHLGGAEHRLRGISDNHCPRFGADIELPVGAAAERHLQHVRIDVECLVYHGPSAKIRFYFVCRVVCKVKEATSTGNLFRR